MQEAALRVFAAVQNHCEARLEKHFAVLALNDSEVAVTQHGAVTGDTAFLSPGAVTASVVVRRSCYRHI